MLFLNLILNNFYYLIQMVNSHQVILVLSIVLAVSCLHFGRKSVAHLDTQSQLNALLEQQNNFQDQINKMVDNISTIEKNVNATSNTSEKVIILEQAISSQRGQIFNLSQSMIPSFNFSKTACQQLTNQQKINLLDQVEKAKKQLDSLKKIADEIPDCDEITAIRQDIAKQELILKSIETTIYTQCESSIVLSPTVFQSNLYAENWILGNQTIDDLIQEYYQRSIQYNNVTNCPISYPFFDGKSCIQCKGNNSIFNMQTKKCDQCPTDTSINKDLRKCQQMPHNSNFNEANNYNLDGASELPKANPNLTDCPTDKPFFNDKQCLNCESGTWWSVKDKKCKSCSTGQVFDINEKACVKPSGSNYLTLLQKSNWVTGVGNYTKVLQERVDVLSKNKTSGECSINSPYWDGIECINCEHEFDLNTLKCTSAPNGSVYDANIHAYIPKETNKETYVNANNIISSSPLKNTSTPDCNSSFPFYDGKGCIICYEPFTLFDTKTLKCVACNPTQIYDASSLQCKPRDYLYISTNFNQIMATNKTSLDDYKAELLNKVKNNGEKIVAKCSDPNEFSNYTSCFKCSSNQYFNIETKKCQSCNGNINSTTKICQPKATLLTNLTSATNLILNNKTIKDYTADQKSISGPTQYCPKDKPYAVSGSSCIACQEPSLYFNLSSMACTNCSSVYSYDSKTMECLKIQNVTNVTALKDYVEVGNNTISALKSEIEAEKKKGPVQECPVNLPIYNDSKCISCPSGTYFNLQNNTCYTPKQVDNVTQLDQLDNVFESKDHTIADINSTIQKQKPFPTQACPKDKPAFDGKKCYNCSAPLYYKLQTETCVQGKTVSNITELKKLKNVKEQGSSTLANMEAEIKKEDLPTIECDSKKPLYDGKKCITCDNYSQYNLKNKNCTPPQMYTNVTAIKESGNYFESGTSTLAILEQNNSKIADPKKPCPTDKPFYNKTECVAIPSGTVYDVKTNSCVKPQLTSNVTALKASNTYIQQDNYTLKNIESEIAKMTEPHQNCSSSTPLFDGTKCISCANGTYYSLKSLKCVSATFVSNVDAIKKQGNYIESGSNTLANLNSSIQASKTPTQNCPSDKPFLINSTCTSCKGSYYNLASTNCSSCINTQQYNTTSHQCQNKANYYPNITNNNWIVTDQSGYDQFEKLYKERKAKNNSKQCFAGSEFYNNNTNQCVNCSKGQYFNYQTYKCQSCGNGKQVDQNTRKCIAPMAEGKYQTSLESANLTYGGLSKSQLQDNYKQNKTKYPSIQDCPKQTPFYDGYECIKCRESMPYFNLVTKQCAFCPSPSKYDANVHDCVDQSGSTVQSSSNPGKMLSSIF